MNLFLTILFVGPPVIGILVAFVLPNISETRGDNVSNL